MPIVQGTAIAKACHGSREQDLTLIHDAAIAKYGKLNIIATFESRLLAFNEEKKLREITFRHGEEGLEFVFNRASDAVPVLEDADIPVVVGRALKCATFALMRGENPDASELAEAAALVKPGEPYWLSDVITKIEESIAENDWTKMYEANIDRIRTSLHGRIREIEGRVPKTYYAKIAETRLVDFEKEIRESMGILRSVFAEVSTGCTGLSFGEKQEFLGAVRDSLLAESQVVVDLLGKADKLFGRSGLPMIAKAHDQLADRARTMAIVFEYMKGRALPTSKE